MKKIQKCLGIGLSFLIMTSCINLQSMANETDLNSGGEILQDLYNEQITEQKEVINEEQLMSMLSAQSELNHINAKLQDQVVIRHYSEVVTRSGDVDDAETLYADYYSGSYIEDSKLIVCISENGSPSNLSQDVLNEESVEIKKVTFSYNELLGFQTNIEDKYEEYYTEYDNTDTKEFELLSSIAGIGIDISNNCVYVDIADLTKEKENTYHTLFGEDEHASLRSVEHLNQDAATFKPGRAIYIILSADPLKTTRASMGYRAFWRPGDNDVYGFASCAHAIENAVGKKIYMGSNFEKVMGLDE